MGPQDKAALLLDRQGVFPPGWTVVYDLQLAQMVCSAPAVAVQKHHIKELSHTNTAEMLALTELTKPGPFGPRTPELGAYFGIFDADRLIAMAGERLRLAGFTEISAVCTNPDFRGRGYASSLVSALVRKIVERGETPFLHVKADNADAVHVYEKLGFSIRRFVNLAVLSREVI
jgi:predicted GNAT family acetyltransferase